MRKQATFDAEIVFAACAQFDTAVEINCRPERQDPPDDLLDLALEWGCQVSIDTDAHAPGQLEWQPYGCDKAARHGIDRPTIVNTLARRRPRRLGRRARRLTARRIGALGRAARSVVRPMSKKTNKRKINARRKKANHGTKPNAGR